jgi:predicted enzyme related to lactoylglutathione lyase
MPGVIHFEIPVDKSDRAAKFYSSIFAWKIEKSPMLNHRLADTGPGITG